MEQRLVATQESFVRISEEAAGRLDDIRGKVVASESSVTSEREALRLQVKQLQEKLGSQERQQADVSNQFGGQGKRLDQLASDLKAQQESAAQLVAQLDGKLQTLAAEQEKLKALQVELGKTNEQLKALGGDVAALKKQGNPSQTIKGIQDDLLVLRSQARQPPGPGRQYRVRRLPHPGDAQHQHPPGPGAEPAAAAQYPLTLRRQPPVAPGAGGDWSPRPAKIPASIALDQRIRCSSTPILRP